MRTSWSEIAPAQELKRILPDKVNTNCKRSFYYIFYILPIP